MATPPAAGRRCGCRPAIRRSSAAPGRRRPTRVTFMTSPALICMRRTPTSITGPMARLIRSFATREKCWPLWNVRALGARDRALWRPACVRSIGCSRRAARMGARKRCSIATPAMLIPRWCRTGTTITTSRIHGAANWPTLGPDLDGKIHLIVGTADTFYLDGAAHKLQAVLDDLHANQTSAFCRTGRTSIFTWRARTARRSSRRFRGRCMPLRARAASHRRLQLSRVRLRGPLELHHSRCKTGPFRCGRSGRRRYTERVTTATISPAVPATPEAPDRVTKRVLLLKPRGFCAGVVRAIDIVRIALETFGAPIYVRKEIVHNRSCCQ